MDIYNYEIIGYEAYQNILPELQQKLDDLLKDEEYHYVLAVNEAVCNAARYSVFGPAAAQIKIKLQITDCDISLTVMSQTRPFHAMRYKEQLVRLLDDKNFADMDWGDYTADTEKSRGFWYMLSGCDYLYIAEDGQEITLSTRTPYDKKYFTAKIKDLVPRFFVKKNEVIL